MPAWTTTLGEASMKGSITVRDVAKALGVSPSTVSRALSSSALVAPRTRQQIIDKSREMGYTPNNAARGLVTGRKGTLGLVVPDLENPYFASVTKGVQARALTTGYSVFVADSDEDARLELELVRKLKPQVDGLILCSSRMPDADLASLVGDTPVLLINRRMEGLPHLTLDDEEIVRQALEHLCIEHLNGPRSKLGVPSLDPVLCPARRLQQVVHLDLEVLLRWG